MVKFLAAMNPAADVLALASLEVDISNLEPGNCMIVKWRGKPVFIRSRTGMLSTRTLFAAHGHAQECSHAPARTPVLDSRPELPYTPFALPYWRC